MAGLPRCCHLRREDLANAADHGAATRARRRRQQEGYVGVGRRDIPLPRRAADPPRRGTAGRQTDPAEGVLGAESGRTPGAHDLSRGQALRDGDRVQRVGWSGDAAQSSSRGGEWGRDAELAPADVRGRVREPCLGTKVPGDAARPCSASRRAASGRRSPCPDGMVTGSDGRRGPRRSSSNATATGAAEQSSRQRAGGGGYARRVTPDEPGQDLRE